jgi:hypothetical protein
LDLPVIVGEPIPILYIQMDGTGVPVVKKETQGRRGKTDGQPAHTREAKLGCVFIQTTWDKEGYPIRDPGFHHLHRRRADRRSPSRPPASLGRRSLPLSTTASYAKKAWRTTYQKRLLDKGEIEKLVVASAPSSRTVLRSLKSSAPRRTTLGPTQTACVIPSAA